MDKQNTKHTSPLSKITTYLQTDFLDLNANGHISRAKNLNKICGEEIFKTDLLPGYFCGDLNAKTVMVNLNPGKNEEDNKYDIELKKQLIKCSSSEVETLIKTHIENCKNVTGAVEQNGEKGKRKISPFDRKTAAFILEFDNKGFDISDFTKNQKDTETVFEAVKTSLKEKLQLEFFPYPSKSIKLNFAKISNHLTEYTDFVFDVIFSTNRNHVIFAARKFNNLFKKYQDDDSGLSYSFESRGEFKKKLKDFKNQVSCAVWTATRKSDGKKIDFIIACTFPMQSLVNKNQTMKEYGKFCAEMENK